MAELSEGRHENDIIEGFLCPICKADLKSFSRLKSHFQDNHPEDQDVLKSLKDLFGKAKQKILKLDESSLESFNSLQRFDQEPEIQEVGYVRTHTKYFKAVRYSKLENFATETNKLIIRLDQLLQADSSDRRAHEQSVVEWLDGTNVKLCPQCAKSFNITRRQHHCRLCGSIMCHSCTAFLSFQAAKNLISGALTTNTEKVLNENNSLRLCGPCMDMLESKRRLQLNRSVQPIICDLYNHLRSLQKKIEPEVELYNKMCASLHNGESTFTLPDTQALRGDIAKQAESLDFISKKIALLPANPDIPRATTLQNAIRRSVSNYIKDYLLLLPALPTLAEIQEKQKRMQNHQVEPSRNFKPTKVTINSGWSPAAVSETVTETSNDPLVQQMDIVRGYIKQARDALRFEEVASLEAHLRELQMFYREERRNRERNKTET